MDLGGKKQLILDLMPRVTGVFVLSWATSFSLVVIFVVPLPARSQIYSCKDAAGRTISSDRPMPECADRVIRELSKTGVLKREIPAPLTPEQRRQSQLEKEKRRIAAAAIEEQRQQDRALLARYRNESDIEASRRYYLGLSQDTIKRDQDWIADAEKQLKEAQAETEFYKNKKIPTDVLARIEEARRVLEEGKTNMRSHQKDMVDTNAKFDLTLARYRGLSRPQSAVTSR
ncbi:DUF4124 domain-containing protein [Glaciimonas sp. PCH181]|uniref:DUF4124 domain-containing protein n=1 Tax=Glaciimonas sp. PCH181 TaxID=2133943 RepID=UPI000D3C0A0B|nr:DUF4124 domain-containing protein [Glaciimonas sp. PCH181]PUA18134.1 DUF4124 domain-containing protein [Glaciimonas sp. PCH181]